MTGQNQNANEGIGGRGSDCTLTAVDAGLPDASWRTAERDLNEPISHGQFFLCSVLSTTSVVNLRSDTKNPGTKPNSGVS
jgi:hypothetical protein